MAVRPAQDAFSTTYYVDRSLMTWEVLKEVEHTLPHVKGPRVLDVAAGSGRHAHLLRYHGFDVTTTDYHDNGLPQHVVGDFFSVDLPGPFDTLVSFHFIEHLPLPDLERALARMAQLARERAVLVMPHPRHRDYKKDPTHAGVPLQYIRAAVRDAFGTVREDTYHNLVPHPPHNPYSWINLVRRVANPRTFTNVMFVCDP